MEESLFGPQSPCAMRVSGKRGDNPAGIRKSEFAAAHVTPIGLRQEGFFVAALRFGKLQIVRRCDTVVVISRLGA